MNTFPQLHTGTVTQLPVSRSRELRTVQTTTPGGATRTYFDEMASSVSWKLIFRALTLAEWTQLQQFFHSMQGRLTSFTFLDPTDNLLTASQNLPGSAWQAASAFSAQAGIDDPIGGTKAFRVSSMSQSGVELVQNVITGPHVDACLSAWIRASAGSRVQLSGGMSTGQFTLRGGWQRLAVPLSSGDGDNTQVTVRGAGISSFDIYGLQLEAQPAPSAYKPTYGAGGVYPNARFNQDKLSGVIDGPDSVHTEVHILAYTQGNA